MNQKLKIQHENDKIYNHPILWQNVSQKHKLGDLKQNSYQNSKIKLIFPESEQINHHSGRNQTLKQHILF